MKISNCNRLIMTFLVCTSFVLCVFLICFTICFTSIAEHFAEIQGVIPQDNDNDAIKYLGLTCIILAVGFVLCLLAALGYRIYVKHKKDILQTDDSHSFNNKE